MPVAIPGGAWAPPSLRNAPPGISPGRPHRPPARGRVVRWSALAGLVLGLATAAARPAPLSAQQSGPEDHRAVVSLQFEGTGPVDVSELKATLYTQSSQCRSIVLKLFCLVSHAPAFYARHDLDPQQLARDQLRIRAYYWLRGWRHAQARATVTPQGRGVAVTFVVEPGTPVQVAERSVHQTRPVLSRGQIGRAGIPAAGDRLSLVQLDTARERLKNQLWDRGHGNAAIEDTAIVSDSLTRADLEVTIEPGPVTTIDTVVVEGNQAVSTRSIERLLDLSRGQVYKRRSLNAAQLRLYRSQMFRQALVTVPDTTDSAKTVVVTVQEAPLHALRLGAGFNTVEFAQAEAHYTLYNWLGGARTLTLNTAVGNLLAPQLYGQSIFGSAVPRGIGGTVDPAYLSPTWQVSLEFNQPWFFSPRLSLGVGGFTTRRSIPGIVIERDYGGTLTFTRRLADGVPLSLDYRFGQTRQEADQVYFCIDFGVCDQATIATLRGTHRLSPLTLRLQVDRSDDPLEPTAGSKASVTLEHASALTGSQFRYNRLEADYSHYFSVGLHSTLAAHVRAGWVRALSSTASAMGLEGSQTALLHPQERFYAGGSQSVRGYGENQLGPRILTVDPQRLLTASDSGAATCTEASLADASCNPNILPASAFTPRPVGGTSVLEGSVEYRFPILNALTGAVFVDGARVGAPGAGLPGRPRSAITPGVGIRYSSPVGPVRIDLAFHQLGSEALGVVTQVPGPDGQPRLVRLATTEQYDPGAGYGGLRRLLSRLQLHLAIGEAF